MDTVIFKSLMNKDKPTPEEILALPKVVLHEHLDGGLRPSTILDIAQEIGYTLPTHDLHELEKWFYEQCNSGSLVRYLQCFDVTIKMMQRKKDLVRIAKECVYDLAEDGVIYAEIRYAPELFVNDDLDCDLIIQAVNEGFAEGMAEVNANNAFSMTERSASLPQEEADLIDPSKAKYRYPIRVESLLCSLRQHSNAVAEKIAGLAIKYRDQHICGFDIAGPENGFPPRRHLNAFDKLRRENMHFTIHAGEDFGLPSIWEAIQICGSERLGHGVRLIDDILDSTTDKPIVMTDLPTDLTSDDLKKLKLGRLASYVRDRRITLEVCPTSNLQTGCITNSDLKLHPVNLLHLLRYRVTVNTDNRLMSGTTMTRELNLMVETFGWTFADLQRVTINAMKSSFIAFDERVPFIKQIIKPAFKQIVALKHGAHTGTISHAGSGHSVKSTRSGKSGKYFFFPGGNKSMKHPSIERERSLSIDHEPSLSGKTLLLQESDSDDGLPLVIDNIKIMTEEEADEQDDGSEDDENVNDDVVFDDDEEDEDDLLNEVNRSEDLVV